MPFNTIELPVFSPIILSPASVPLASVPSKRTRISPKEPKVILLSINKLSPSFSTVANRPRF